MTFKLALPLSCPKAFCAAPPLFLFFTNSTLVFGFAGCVGHVTRPVRCARAAVLSGASGEAEPSGADRYRLILQFVEDNCTGVDARDAAACSPFLASWDEEAEEEYRPTTCYSAHTACVSAQEQTAACEAEAAGSSAEFLPIDIAPAAAAAAPSTQVRRKRYARISRAERIAAQRAAGVSPVAAAKGALEDMPAWLPPQQDKRERYERIRRFADSNSLRPIAGSTPQLAFSAVSGGASPRWLLSYCEEACGELASFDETSFA